MAHCQAVTCFPRPVPWAPSVSVMLIILLVSIVLNQMVHMSEVGRYTSLVAVNTGLRIQRCRTPQIGISWIRFSSIFFPEEIHHAKLWHLNTFVIRAAARRCRARDIAISKPHKSYAMIAVATSASAHMMFARGSMERGGLTNGESMLVRCCSESWTITDTSALRPLFISEAKQSWVILHFLYEKRIVEKCENRADIEN